MHKREIQGRREFTKHAQKFIICKENSRRKMIEKVVIILFYILELHSEPASAHDDA